MHIAVVSLGKSAGCTSTAVGLSMALSESGDAVLVELDPGGGDLAGLWDLTDAHGVSTLIGAVSASTDDDPSAMLRRHSQVSPYGFGVVPCSTSPGVGLERTVSDLGGQFGFVLDQADFPVVSDCGRWSGSRGSRERVRSASAVVAVMTPDRAGADRAVSLLAALVRETMTPHIYVLSMGDRPYAPAEVGAVLGCAVRAIPQDSLLVRSVLLGEPTGERAVRKLRRTPWWRTMVGLRAEILGDVTSFEAVDGVVVDGE